MKGRPSMAADVRKQIFGDSREPRTRDLAKPKKKKKKKSDPDYEPVVYNVSILTREDIRPTLVSLYNRLNQGRITNARAKVAVSILTALLKFFSDQEEAEARRERIAAFNRMLSLAEKQGVKFTVDELLLEGREVNDGEIIEP